LPLAIAMACAVALAASGCGGGGESSTPAELKLEREDLIAVARALRAAEGPVAGEVATAKRAWPLIAGGLPAGSSARVPVAAAQAAAARIAMPAPMQEASAGSLTGPAARLAGLFRSYLLLSTRGWTLTGAAIDQAGRGSPAAASFARMNAGLYIESVYDGHFTLAQTGKQLLESYRMLGGPRAFAGSLSQDEVNALASSYSEAAIRLHPHVAERLGS
jgi:hypothetical protein